MIITKAIKSHFYIIVALASIVGSTIAVPHISNFAAVNSLDPSSLIPDASAVSLPFEVDHHIQIKEKVGDAVTVDEQNDDADRNCEMSCTYVRYQPGSQGIAGLAYISGTPLDLSGAKKVHFFLMGDKGGEKVIVKIAGKVLSTGQKADSPFKEKFAKSTGAITLPNDWKRYEISLNGVDLKGIVAPFAIELLKGNKTSAVQAVYFKFIVYENQPVDSRFALAANTTTTNSTSPTTTTNSTSPTTTTNSTSPTTTTNSTSPTTTTNSTSPTTNSTSPTTNSTSPTTDSTAKGNSPPVASNVSATTNQDKPVSITLKATDSDKGDTLTFSVSKTANGGKISNFDNKAGTLTYTPPAGFSGQDAFNFKATDNHGAESNIATVTVTINKVNSAPTATDDTASTNADTPVVIPVLKNDSDPDGNNHLTIDSITRQPSSGTATINKSNGTITYSPNSGFTGTDTFEYSISDGNGGTDTAKVTVTVNPVNHSPVASNIKVTTDQDKPVSITLKATDSDKGDTLTFSVSKTANGGKISNFDNKAGTLTYTPPAGFSGQDAFNFKATDSHGAASNTATVTISINRINKPPIANAGSNATVDEGTRGYYLNGTGSTDPDGQITKYIWTQTAGPAVTLDTTSHPGYAIFDVPFVTGSTTKLTFELIVEDNDGARSQPDSVVISIKDLGPNPQMKP
jgi:hypothetical protein